MANNIWKISYGMKYYSTKIGKILFRPSFYDNYKDNQYSKYWQMKDNQRNRRIWLKLRAYSNPKKRCLSCIKVVI